ncbi:MAG: SIS domain-containing protein [Bacteroidetes bacterium]|nr:SIS domain-containing protein [Bacteroidota bacterium]
MKVKIKDILSDSLELKKQLLQDEKLHDKIIEAVNSISGAFEKGCKVLFCGNGGSAADAQHLAAEFSGRFYKDRKALPAEALHCNTSYLTAVGNDYGFDEVYARIINGTGHEGDVLVAFSTSGNSANIVKALKAAKNKKMLTIGFTGIKGGTMNEFCQLIFHVPSSITPRIQECHILLGHIICELVEENLFS